MSDNPCPIRRSVIQGLGAGALLATIGCAPDTRVVKSAYPRAYSRLPWAAPRISMDAVIRVIVGHRPLRPQGFRVEREQFDDKLVVHNYGHSGGGLSLGWGSSALALREVAGLAPREVAVLGSGIMGLCTARLLQDAGWSVTIYTRDMYRHTTSNVAAGEWGPEWTYTAGHEDAAFLRRLDRAARISHHAYTNLTGPKYGIRWVESYELYESPPADQEHTSFDDLFTFKGLMKPGEHPFGDWYVSRRVTMQIDPGTLLRQLTADFQLAGGTFVIRTFTSLEQVLTLGESVIFNCTGLGAAELFGDPDLVPAKGQIVFLPPDPAVDYISYGGGDEGESGFLQMLPRGDVLLLGGIFKTGDASRHVETDETERMVEEHRKLYERFG